MAAALWISLSGISAATERVGTTFPADFPEIIDTSLGVPVIGFGASRPGERTPVILLHGNNDTPYPTECNGSFGHMQAFAQHLLEHGYRASELWAPGYQGDQCDTVTDPTVKSSAAHSTAENVPVCARSRRRCSPTPARHAWTSSGTAWGASRLNAGDATPGPTE